MVIILHGQNGVNVTASVSKYAPETTPIQHQSILGKIAQDRVRNFEIAQIVKVCVLNILFFYFQLNLSITSVKLSPDELGVSVH